MRRRARIAAAICERPNLRVRVFNGRLADESSPVALKGRDWREEDVRAKTNMVKRIRAHGGCLGAVRR